MGKMRLIRPTSVIFFSGSIKSRSGDFSGIVVNPFFGLWGVLGILKGVKAFMFHKNAQKKVKIGQVE